MAEHSADASREEYRKSEEWAKEYAERRGTDWRDEAYIRKVFELGLNRNTDIDLLNYAQVDLSQIDLRHWQGDEEMKDAIRAARDALQTAMELGFARYWAAGQ